MPRDLLPTKPSPGDPPILTESPEMKSPGNRFENFDDRDEDGEDAHQSDTSLAYSIFRDHRDNMEVELSQKFKSHDDLHPHVQVLSISDLEACVALENAAFSEDERCSREKFIYRLTTSPSLCLGLFSSTTAAPNPATQAAHDTARPPDSSKPSHKSLLLGHVIATLTTSTTVTDASMDFPPSFPSHPEFSAEQASSTPPPAVLAREPSQTLPDSTFPRINQSADIPGHHPLGRTVAVHSVAILPAYHRLGLGKTLFKSYLQRMESAGIADRAALLAREKMVGWYVGNFGFEDHGESSVKYAGGGWRDLTYDFHETGNWS